VATSSIASAQDAPTDKPPGDDPPGAGEEEKEITATVSKLTGEADAKRPTDKDWVKAKVKMVLPKTSEFATGFESTAELILNDSTVIHIKALTELRIDTNLKKGDSVKSEINLEFGTLEIEVKKSGFKSDIKISAPNSSTAIRGSFVIIQCDPEARDIGREGAGDVIQGKPIPGVSVTVQEGDVIISSDLSDSQVVPGDGGTTDESANMEEDLLIQEETVNGTPIPQTSEESGVGEAGGSVAPPPPPSVNLPGDETDTSTPQGQAQTEQEGGGATELPGPPSPPP